MTRGVRICQSPHLGEEVDPIGLSKERHEGKRDGGVGMVQQSPLPSAELLIGVKT